MGADAKDDFVGGMSDGFAFSAERTKALKQKTEDRCGETVGLDHGIQELWSGGSRRSCETQQSSFVCYHGKGSRDSISRTIYANVRRPGPWPGAEAVSL